ncbi:MAG: DUF1292 domain-containing protein [Oscillospiraceae bacterium]|nr:DUF1292 domain-containing protein [Oscillospiraceae bacterium]
MSDRFNDAENNGLVGDDEHDIVEFSDDDGNTLMLEVMDYFFYNGEEYAVLMDAGEASERDHGHGHGHEHGPGCDHCEGEEESMYIMRVLSSINEDGEEMEEFVPVDDDLLDKLVEVVQARFADDDIVMDDEDEDDDDDEEDDDYEYDGDDDFEDGGEDGED